MEIFGQFTLDDANNYNYVVKNKRDLELPSKKIRHLLLELISDEDKSQLFKNYTELLSKKNTQLTLTIKSEVFNLLCDEMAAAPIRTRSKRPHHERIFFQLPGGDDCYHITEFGGNPSNLLGTIRDPKKENFPFTAISLQATKLLPDSTTKHYSCINALKISLQGFREWCKAHALNEKLSLQVLTDDSLKKEYGYSTLALSPVTEITKKRSNQSRIATNDSTNETIIWWTNKILRKGPSNEGEIPGFNNITNILSVGSNGDFEYDPALVGITPGTKDQNLSETASSITASLPRVVDNRNNNQRFFSSSSSNFHHPSNNYNHSPISSPLLIPQSSNRREISEVNNNVTRSPSFESYGDFEYDAAVETTDQNVVAIASSISTTAPHNVNNCNNNSSFSLSSSTNASNNNNSDISINSGVSPFTPQSSNWNYPPYSTPSINTQQLRPLDPVQDSAQPQTQTKVLLDDVVAPQIERPMQELVNLLMGQSIQKVSDEVFQIVIKQSSNATTQEYLQYITQQFVQTFMQHPLQQSQQQLILQQIQKFMQESIGESLGEKLRQYLEQQFSMPFTSLTSNRFSPPPGRDEPFEQTPIFEPSSNTTEESYVNLENNPPDTAATENLSSNDNNALVLDLGFAGVFHYDAETGCYMRKGEISKNLKTLAADLWGGSKEYLPIGDVHNCFKVEADAQTLSLSPLMAKRLNTELFLKKEKHIKPKDWVFSKVVCTEKKEKEDVQLIKYLHFTSWGECSRTAIKNARRGAFKSRKTASSIPAICIIKDGERYNKLAAHFSEEEFLRWNQHYKISEPKLILLEDQAAQRGYRLAEISPNELDDVSSPSSTNIADNCNNNNQVATPTSAGNSQASNINSPNTNSAKQSTPIFLPSELGQPSYSPQPANMSPSISLDSTQQLLSTPIEPSLKELVQLVMGEPMQQIGEAAYQKLFDAPLSQLGLEGIKSLAQQFVDIFMEYYGRTRVQELIFIPMTNLLERLVLETVKEKLNNHLQGIRSSIQELLPLSNNASLVQNSGAQSFQQFPRVDSIPPPIASQYTRRDEQFTPQRSFLYAEPSPLQTPLSYSYDPENPKDPWTPSFMLPPTGDLAFHRIARQNSQLGNQYPPQIYNQNENLSNRRPLQIPSQPLNSALPLQQRQNLWNSTQNFFGSNLPSEESFQSQTSAQQGGIDSYGNVRRPQ